ncbi:methyltransferase domain-containing protein [Bacillaceae bacterium Marseille-Q3522]|nr:methyltransferase domain-containing protein [Bacillaceae bacterium Marseille-Q3522]
MKLDGILPFARVLLEKAVTPGDMVVDATVGNGHDTLFLAKLVGKNGQVFGFDIQEEAIKNSQNKLRHHGVDGRVRFSSLGHEHIIDVLPPQTHGKITAAVFNLGYLPGGNKAIVTRPQTTIQAIEQLISLMAPEGIIVVVIYHGHAEGAKERDALLTYVKQLDQKKAHVLQYQFINQINQPPFIIAIEKR